MADNCAIGYFINMEEGQSPLTVSSGALSLDDKIALKADDDIETFYQSFDRSHSIDYCCFNSLRSATTPLNVLDMDLEIKDQPKLDADFLGFDDGDFRAATLLNSFSPSSIATPFSNDVCETVIKEKSGDNSVSSYTYVSPRLLKKIPFSDNCDKTTKLLSKKPFKQPLKQIDKEFAKEEENLKFNKKRKVSLTSHSKKNLVPSLLNKQGSDSLSNKKKTKKQKTDNDQEKRTRILFTTQEQKLILEKILFFLEQGDETRLDSLLCRNVSMKLLSDITEALENADTRPLGKKCKRAVNDIQKKLVDLRKAYFLTQMSDSDLENHAIWMSKTFNKAAHKKPQKDKNQKAKGKSVLQYYLGLERKRQAVMKDEVVLPLLLALKKYWIKVEQSMRRTSFTTHWDYVNNKEVTAKARSRKV